jgi:hypothetical protein
VAHLIARQAFLNYSRRFGAAETLSGGQVTGSGSRPETFSAQVKPIGKDFVADDAVLEDFRQFLETQKIRVVASDFEENRAEIGRQITEEVIRQVFGEGEARKRTMAWDPQIQRALELVPKAELLLADPQRYIAERQRELRTADLRSSR